MVNYEKYFVELIYQSSQQVLYQKEQAEKLEAIRALIATQNTKLTDIKTAIEGIPHTV